MSIYHQLRITITAVQTTVGHGLNAPMDWIDWNGSNSGKATWMDWTGRYAVRILCDAASKSGGAMYQYQLASRHCAHVKCYFSTEVLARAVQRLPNTLCSCSTPVWTPFLQSEHSLSVTFPPLVGYDRCKITTFCIECGGNWNPKINSELDWLNTPSAFRHFLLALCALDFHTLSECCPL